VPARKLAPDVVRIPITRQQQAAAKQGEMARFVEEFGKSHATTFHIWLLYATE